jgi:hypothetical protein
MKTKTNTLYRACACALSIGAAAIALLPTTTLAQLVVWHDDFDQQPIGANSTDATYGAVAWNFSGAGYGNPVVWVTNDAPDTALQPDGDTNNCAMTFIPDFGGTADNFGLEINWIPASGNTQASVEAYTLEFDMAVQGETISSDPGYWGLGLGLLANNSGIYCGPWGCTGYQLSPGPGASYFPGAGAGYQHYAIGFTNFIAATGDNLMSPTSSPITLYLSFYIAGSSYASTEEIDLANVQIVMVTNPIVIQPTMNILPAKPGLRVFAQDSTHPYNQEGFGTQDAYQSWVGVATPAMPVSYAVTMQDFDTVNGFALFVQFAQNASGGDPYGVYNAQNALVWSIISSGPGGMFTTAVNWKTNAPQSGEPNNALSLSTTSTDGRGTWLLVFTNDLDGTVYAPDGTSGSFSLPDEDVAADLANPCVIDFGSCPNWNSAGYGQWIDYSNIAITNVIDGDEYDDFTQDTSLNTALWNPGFSYNAGSVIQVPAGTSYWVNWTVPDDGFGLETIASLNGGTNVWFSPNYYGNGVVTNSTPTLMGTGPKWTLVPAGCLPTVDGTQGGPVSSTAFFRLSNPPPSQ